MEGPLVYNIEKYNINVMDDIKKVYEKFQKTHIISDKNVCVNKYLGEVSYQLTEEGKEIEIFFSKDKDPIKVFKTPVSFKLDGKEIAITYDINSLKAMLTKFVNGYEFNVEENIKTKNQILDDIPSEIILKKKRKYNSF